MWLCLLIVYACSTLFHGVSYICIHINLVYQFTLETSSLLFPCGCCAAAVVSVSGVEKEFWFFYHSLQCHQSLLFISYWLVLPHAVLHFFLLVWPSLYYICLQLLQMWILTCCCPYVLLMYTRHVHWCADCTYVYSHSFNFLVFIFCVVVMGQPVHNLQVLVRHVCDVHHVLAHMWHNALQPLRQHGHIFAE